jgi:hypothetical protein
MKLRANKGQQDDTAGGAVRLFLSVQAEPDIAGIRTQEFRGSEHLVVPVVALVEGVLHPSNAEAPELALAEEFGKLPPSWDGRPVVLGHPKRDGQPVPANSPDVIENEAFGMLFNTKLDGTKLKTEAWIDLNRVNSMSDDVKAAVGRIQKGEVVEVSTGLFMALEETKGTLDGKEYHGIWRNVVPDHLAILPEGTIGACSVADGCGCPRLNSANRLKNSNPETNMFKALMHRVGGLLKGHFGTSEFRAQEMSDTDRREALRAALEKESSKKWYWVVAVYSDHFVYESDEGKLYDRTYTISTDGKVTLGVQIQQVRPVTEFVPVTNEATQEVGHMTKTERVNALIANKAGKFTENHRAWLESLTEEQLGLLEPVAAPTPAPTPATPAPTANVAPCPCAETPKTPATAAAPTTPSEPVTLEQYINSAPSELREVLQSGVRMNAERRTDLIAGIRANKENQFSEDELKGMSLQTLERMAKLARVPNYEGRAVHSTEPQLTDQSAAPAAPQLFPIKPAA